MKKITLTILAMAFISMCIHAQGVIVGAPVSIDENLSPADPSAMLDIKSSNKGILISRMSTSSRENITDPATGLLVYDYDEQQFWYFNGFEWVPIAANSNSPSDASHLIQDADSSTWVTTEQLPDENQIRFAIDSFEQMRLDGKTMHLEAPGQSLFIGTDAGVNDDGTDNQNIFIGKESGTSNTTGLLNIFVGNNSGHSNTSGYYNFFQGIYSGYSNTTGNQNIFKGISAGYNNTTGSKNIFSGHFSGYANTSGSFNIFKGYYAGFFNTTGSYNLFMGRRAGWKNTTGDNNIFLGFNSGYNSSTGERLIFIGRDAGHQNTSGYQNVFVGSFCGYNNTNGYYNTFLGDDAGKENTSGHYNTFIGLAAGFSNADGNDNTFVGGAAGFSTVSGTANVFLGRYSGFSNISGEENTSIGTFAGQGNSTGSRNTLVGKSSGEDNTSGNDNTYIGYEAGKNNLIGNGNVFIGNQAGINNGESDQLIVDNNGNDIPLLYGDFSSDDLSQRKIGVNRIALTNTFEIDGNASKSSPGEWVSNSDERLKTNIQFINSQEALQKLLSLQGITYEWDDPYTGYQRPEGKQYGFSAQNIQEVYPTLVQEDQKGYLETAYGTYDPMFIEALRALQQRLNKLEVEHEKLKQELAKGDRSAERP